LSRALALPLQFYVLEARPWAQDIAEAIVEVEEIVMMLNRLTLLALIFGTSLILAEVPSPEDHSSHNHGKSSAAAKMTRSQAEQLGRKDPFSAIVIAKRKFPNHKKDKKGKKILSQIEKIYIRERKDRLKKTIAKRVMKDFAKGLSYGVPQRMQFEDWAIQFAESLKKHSLLAKLDDKDADDDDAIEKMAGLMHSLSTYELGIKRTELQKERNELEERAKKGKLNKEERETLEYLKLAGWAADKAYNINKNIADAKATDNSPEANEFREKFAKAYAEVKNSNAKLDEDIRKGANGNKTEKIAAKKSLAKRKHSILQYAASLYRRNTPKTKALAIDAIKAISHFKKGNPKAKKRKDRRDKWIIPVTHYDSGEKKAITLTGNIDAALRKGSDIITAFTYRPTAKVDPRGRGRRAGKNTRIQRDGKRRSNKKGGSNTTAKSAGQGFFSILPGRVGKSRSTNGSGSKNASFTAADLSSGLGKCVSCHQGGTGAMKKRFSSVPSREVNAAILTEMFGKPGASFTKAEKAALRNKYK